MKVLHVKRNMSKGYSGATRSVYDVIAALSDIQYSNYIFCEKINSKEASQFQVSSTTSRFYWPWQNKISQRQLFSKRAMQYAQQHDFDCVIGHGDVLRQDILFVHNCVHLAHERIYQETLPKDHEMYQMHASLLEQQQFRHVIANSELMKRDFVNRFHIKPEKISVLYPSLNTAQFFRQDDALRATNKAKLGFKEDEIVVGLITSGNLRKRGIDIFLQATAQLPASLASKVKFVFVGSGDIPVEYRSLLETHPYRNHIVRLPVTPKVEDYYNILDIFVLPARIEEFGRVVNEAMACGAAVLTTRWVGASELLPTEAADFICEDAVEPIRDRLIRLIEDEALRRHLGELNIQMASQASLAVFIENFTQLIQQVMGGK